MTKNKKNSGEERRRARRTNVLESFNLFLVIPQMHGMARIYLRDISRLGLCFRSEMEGEYKAGQKLEARLYINPAFYLEFKCRVVRIIPQEIGVEFTEPESAAAQALAKLQDFFEAAEVAGVLVE